jgi:hypothetical protein
MVSDFKAYVPAGEGFFFQLLQPLEGATSLGMIFMA